MTNADTTLETSSQTSSTPIQPEPPGPVPVPSARPSTSAASGWTYRAENAAGSGYEYLFCEVVNGRLNYLTEIEEHYGQRTPGFELRDNAWFHEGVPFEGIVRECSPLQHIFEYLVRTHPGFAADEYRAALERAIELARTPVQTMTPHSGWNG